MAQGGEPATKTMRQAVMNDYSKINNQQLEKKTRWTGAPNLNDGTGRTRRRNGGVKQARLGHRATREKEKENWKMTSGGDQ
jgi:hypothetical protein